MFATLREDIACIRERDPAARSAWEVVTCYPGLHAIVAHRVAHALWRRGWLWTARWISHWARFLTGIEIHPGATIGRRVFIDHGMGVVIGETAEVGDDCTIYQGVTLGGTSLTRGAKRHPTLGRGVIVGASSQVLGGFTVGDGARIGSSAVVVKPVPPGATAVGNPARIVGGPEAGAPSAQAASPVAAAGAPAPAPQAPSAGPEADPSAARAPGLVPGFSAYGVTPGPDPMSQAMKGLINTAAVQDEQIAKLWCAIEQLARRGPTAGPLDDCVPPDAQKEVQFDAGKLTQLVK